ncbi:MAG: peroxiredoxin [Gammaproteobacteria bacterium]
MLTTRLKVHLLACILLLMGNSVVKAEPTEGDSAPGFRLQDQKGAWHDLSDYQGQWVVLYFYPKDGTPGCTTEACNFRDDILRFKAMGVKLLGVSVDDIESHSEFAEKHQLPFPLLADASKNVTETYGVLRDSSIGKIANRETFIIGPEGTIVRHYAKVDPDTHSAELLIDLGDLLNQNEKPQG